MWNMHLELAPQSGLLLAYLNRELLFVPYEVKGGELLFEGSERYLDAHPHECHLFDADTEYRMVRRSSRGDAIEVVLTRQEEDAMDEDLLLAEEPLVRDEYASDSSIPARIRIVNRYAYTENDTLVLTNYRISLPEGDEK